MKVWLDDLRVAPQGWVWAKTVSEAQNLLQNGNVEEMSLDHDLGAYPCDRHCWAENGLLCDRDCGCACHRKYPDGSDLVRWMIQENLWPQKTVAVHSSNPVGRRTMLDLLRSHAPDTLTIHK